MPTKVKTKKVKVEKVEEEAIPTQYSADILLINEPQAKNERIGQVQWIADGGRLCLAIFDTRFATDLERFITGDIVTAEGRTYSPGLQPKEWVLNLYKVAPRKLWDIKWGATEARASYEN